MSESEQKRCPRCGAGFICHAPNRCWCEEMPPLATIHTDTDCLCPKCLREATEEESAARAGALLARDGFTLVELLVTIAVISILAALLLPAVGKGKLAAKSTLCQSNLRQFVLAAQMYWDENGGNSFAYVGATTQAGTYYWFGLLGDGPEETRSFDPSKGPLYPWLGAGVDFCPSFDYSSTLFKLKASIPTCDYGYNAYIFGPPLNLTKLATPSALALMADAAQVNTFEAPASPKHPMFEEWYYIDNEIGLADPQPNVQFRHQLRANVVFVDGHVMPEQMVPGSLDPRLPTENIGSLPASMLLP